MAHSTDIVGYTYQADEYCPDCIWSQVTIPGAVSPLADIEASLTTLAGMRDIDRQDERSYDSGDFPKVIFREMLTVGDEGYGDGEDHADRCGSCGLVLGD